MCLPLLRDVSGYLRRGVSQCVSLSRVLGPTHHHHYHHHHHHHHHYQHCHYHHCRHPARAPLTTRKNWLCAPCAVPSLGSRLGGRLPVSRPNLRGGCPRPSPSEACHYSQPWPWPWRRRRRPAVTGWRSPVNSLDRAVCPRSHSCSDDHVRVWTEGKLFIWCCRVHAEFDV